MYQSSPQLSFQPTYISRSSPLEYIAHSARNYSSQQQSHSTYHSAQLISTSPSISFSKSPLQDLINPVPTPYKTQSESYIHHKIQPEYIFQPDHFLKPSKHPIFVNTTQEVQEYIEETFQELFQQPLPKNIKISILNKKEFQTLTPSPNTVGLSINRSKQNLLSEIFILNDTLPRVLLTIGHELGHILTPTLSNPHDEEAKAYAFSLAWIEVIKEQNIANLSNHIITESPAQNGLHDISYNFIAKIIRTGKTAWELYQEIIKEIISIRTQII